MGTSITAGNLIEILEKVSPETPVRIKFCNDEDDGKRFDDYCVLNGDYYIVSSSDKIDNGIYLLEEEL